MPFRSSGEGATGVVVVQPSARAAATRSSSSRRSTSDATFKSLNRDGMPSLDLNRSTAPTSDVTAARPLAEGYSILPRRA